MTDPIPKTEDLELDEILESLAEIGRGWVIDQLDGTSFIKDALDGIEQEKAEAKQAILALIEEQKKALLDLVEREVIGDKEYYHEHYPFVRSPKMQEEVEEKIARDELRIEQREKLNTLRKN